MCTLHTVYSFIHAFGRFGVLDTCLSLCWYLTDTWAIYPPMVWANISYFKRVRLKLKGPCKNDQISNYSCRALIRWHFQPRVSGMGHRGSQYHTSVYEVSRTLALKSPGVRWEISLTQVSFCSIPNRRLETLTYQWQLHLSLPRCPRYKSNSSKI